MKENTIQDRKWQLIVDQTVAPWCVCFNFNSVGPQKFRRFCDSEHKFLITVPKLQSRTKLLEKVFPIMFTFLRNKTISKTTPLREEIPFPQFNVASYKRPGIRLPFEHTTTSLPGEGGEGRTGTATMFRKMLPRYTIFSTVLSKIVAFIRFQ